MRFPNGAGVAVLLPILAASAVLAGETTTRITGEVVGIERALVEGESGPLQRITVRTRSGELCPLLLGEPGGCPGCLRVGDRVRARVTAGPREDGPRLVRSLRVRRTGERFTFRAGGSAGEGAQPGIRRRTRARARDRSCGDSPRGGGRRP